MHTISNMLTHIYEKNYYAHIHIFWQTYVRAYTHPERSKMYQEMSPVTEVSIYESKQAITKRIHSRTQNVLAQRNNFYHAHADHIVVEQNAHCERDQKRAGRCHESNQ